MVVPGVNEPKACSVNQIFKHFEENFGIDDVPLFSDTKPYYVGNVCRYNNKIYRFKREHTGAWSVSDVEETSLFTSIETMREEIEAFVGVGKEDVTISCSTVVPGVSVAGLKFMVYFNGSQTGHEYVTDADGNFVVPVTRNYSYRIVPPSIEGCGTPDTIIGYATTSRNTYDVVYSNIKTFNEVVTIVLSSFVGTTKTALSDRIVKITSEGVTKRYTSDAQGKVSVLMAKGADYEVEFPEIDGMYIAENKYKYRFVAESNSRVVIGTYSNAETGVFVVCDNGSEYNFEEFKNKNIDINTARLIKISSSVLGKENAAFGVGIDDLRSRNYTGEAWQGDNNNQFNSVGNGYHYDGYGNSIKQKEEADARSLIVPAMQKCLETKFVTSHKTYNGFLGSVYQWMGIWSYRALIDEILEYTRPLDDDGNFTHKVLNIAKKGYNFSSYTAPKWTSDQSNASYACYFGSGASNFNKSNGFAAVPFYAF